MTRSGPALDHDHPELAPGGPERLQLDGEPLQLGQGAHAAVLHLGDEARPLDIQPTARAGRVADPAEQSGRVALL